MKLSYKKDWKIEAEKNKRLQNERNMYKSKVEDLNKRIDVMEIRSNLLEKEKMDLVNKVKELQGSKGGLTKQNNELKRQISELKEKLKESMSNKYIVRKIPSGRTPNMQKTRVTKTPKPGISNYIRRKSLETIIE